ncbi:MAG: sensor histidine kinase [Nocardiopsaceae bacterium]|nr:sensor histidine kinase [Nocardiopsaceae bacterium]
MRRGHWVALDCLAAAPLALGTAASTTNEGPAPLGPLPGGLLLGLVLAAAVFVPVGFRRLRPIMAYGALVLLAALLALARPGPHSSQFVLAVSGYALYTVTVQASKRTGLAALGLGLVLDLIIAFGGQPDAGHPLYGVAVPVALVLVIAWMTGHAVRQRRRYARALQHQATSKAVTEDRLRIARELHDVVAHSMSVIAVQAGFGQYVIDTSPADARDALGAIQATSRDALEEMRRMLGVLRQQDAAAASGVATAASGTTTGASGVTAGPGSVLAATPSNGALGTAPLAPAPGLSGLDRLIERTSGTGIRVSLERSGAVGDVPAGVDLSAYRIIQEALTNVVKHAGVSASCVVYVRCSPDALTLDITNDGGTHATSGDRTALGDRTAPGRRSAPGGRAAPGAEALASGGHGIIGMRERAALCGGSLEAGPVPGGGFRVTATLPLHPAPASNPAPVAL